LSVAVTVSGYRVLSDDSRPARWDQGFHEGIGSGQQAAERMVFQAHRVSRFLVGQAKEKP
jgi:hypothetical protein